MNSPPFTFLLLLTLITTTTTTTSNAHESPSASPQPSTAANNQQPLLTKACESTPLYKDLCISSLSTYPESEVKDLNGLAKYAIEMVSKKAALTHKQIEDMESKSEDEATKKKLNDCEEMYADISDTLKDSVESLDKKAYDDVIESLTAAMNDAEACEDGFKEPPVVKSPLTDVNEMFTKFCSICLAITSTVDK